MKIANIIQAAQQAESTGHFGRAVELCNAALSVDPNCVDALLILGSMNIRQGSVADGEQLLRRAAIADPNSYDAARWLTTLLIGRDGGSEAVAFGQSAVRLRPHDAQAHAILGLAALGSGNHRLAITSFEIAIRLSPMMAGAYHNLGVAFQREEEFEEAIASFKKALELSPNVAETYLHLGRTYLANKQGDEALKCAEKALELNPNLASAIRLKTKASFAAVVGENGQFHLDKEILEHPESAFPQALKGSRLQELGDFEAAEKSLLRSISIEPNQGLAYYILAHNRKTRESDRALYEQIGRLAISPSLDKVQRQYACFALGKVHDDLGEYEKAIHYLDLANGQPDEKVTETQLHDADRHAWRVRQYIKIFTPDFMSRFDSVAIESGEPIFIFGMPRSGTTLIEQILSRHSSVGSGGEISFWRDSGRKIINLHSEEFHPDELTRAGHRYLELIRRIAPGKAHVTDKFPSNYVYLGLLHMVFPKAKFIHAKRHPIDICLSMYMRPFFEAQEDGRTRRRLVETYKLYEESIDHWRRVLPPGRFFDVQYEELVQNPESVSKALIAHCGLDWQEACLQPEAGDRRVITFSKWQVRQPVYTTSVERWRNYEPWLGVFRELLAKTPPPVKE